MFIGRFAKTDAATAVLGVAIVGSVLAIGAVHPTIMCVVAVVVGVAAFLVFSDRPERRVALSAPTLTMLALAGYSLLQALPLPIAMVRAVAPANAAVWAGSLAPFAEASKYASISADPGASVLAALRFATYAMVFAVAAVIGRRRGSTTILSIVFGAAVVTALATMAHSLVGATQVFGIYQPRFGVPPWHLGPLLNGNNLAGYMNLGVFCGLGLLLVRRKTTAPAWILAPGVAALVAQEILSGSRGGLVALGLGLASFALFSVVRRRDRGRYRRAAILGATAVGGGLFAILAFTSQLRAELLDESVQKLETLSWSTPIIHDSFWFGVGRGAYESVFPAYRTATGNIVYTHAENFILQWVDEWGVPVAAISLLVLAWHFRPARLKALSTAPYAGVASALIALCVQNLFDLAFEVPAVCIALIAALGAVSGAATPRATEPALVRSRARFVVATVGAALVGLAFFVGRDEISEARASAYELFKSHDATSSVARAQFRDELRTAMKRHPAEPYFALLGAAEALRGRDQNALPWLQRALERGRNSGETHLVLAEALKGRGATVQALAELKTAALQDPALASRAGELAASWSNDFDELMRALPVGEPGVAMLEGMASRLQSVEQASLKAACYAEIIARDPSQTTARFEDGSALLAALNAEGTALGCGDRAYCEKRIEEHVRAIRVVEPRSAKAMILEAGLLGVAGKVEEAVHRLAETCLDADDVYSCQSARVDLAAKIKDPLPLKKALGDLTNAGCASAAMCAKTMTLEGDVLARRGDYGAAVAAYDRAATEEPTADHLASLASAASNAGEHVRALQALQKLESKRPEDASIRARIENERAAVTQIQ